MRRTCGNSMGSTVKGKGNFVKKDEELMNRQKEKLLKGLEEQALACVQQGVRKQEILDCIEKVTGEVSA